jgi:uncharacterized membrane protein
MEHHTELFDLSRISLTLGEVIGYIGIAIMLVGVAKALWLFFTRQLIGRENILSAIRIELGQYLALGLEFLVGKDIIESLVNPTWDDLGKLAAIIVLRTILTIFLQRELKEIEHDAREEKFLTAALKGKKHHAK